MLSKPLVSRPSRHPGPESSVRPVGLLPTLKRQASKLVLLPSHDKQNEFSSGTTAYDIAMTSAVDNLHIAVKDILCSPGSTGTFPSVSSSVYTSPRTRPRSASQPLVLEVSAALSDFSFLQSKASSSSATPVLANPTIKAAHNRSQQPKMRAGYELATLKVPEQAAPKLTLSKTILGLSSRYSLSKKKKGAIDAPIANGTPQSDRPNTKRGNSESGASLRKHREPDVRKPLPRINGSELVKRETKVSGQDDKGHQDRMKMTSSKSRPKTAHSQCIHEPDTTNTSQKHATSKLQAHFGNSGAARKSHATNSKGWDSVQVPYLKTQVQLLKEQTRKYNLQDASSSDRLTGLGSDYPPRIPVRENVAKRPTTVGSSNSITPSHYDSMDQQLSLEPSPISPGTENIERGPFGTRRRESANQGLLSEPRPYAQNQTFLHDRIDLLTAKLRKSNKTEQELRRALAMRERESANKAIHVDKLTETIQGLHNTVAHLESRLETANIKRVDAEEQLLAWRDPKSAIDLIGSQLPGPSDTNQVALDMQNRTGTSKNPCKEVTHASGVNYLENSMPAALNARLEELQAQVREKDAHIAELNKRREQLQQQDIGSEHGHKKATVQSDLSHELLRETRASNRLIEQLRNAVLDHETTIIENEQAMCALKRQVDYYKLLLQAEIRKHTAMKLYIAAEQHPLTELASLAKREDIDCWMEKLHERLKGEQSENESKAVAGTTEAKLESLRHEIDFYVREIILFKLDIKGYRSDIRKLKDVIAYQRSSRNQTDMEPNASSDEPLASPVQSDFAPFTPELDAFLGAPSVTSYTDTCSRSEECVNTLLPPLHSRTGRSEGVSRQFSEPDTSQPGGFFGSETDGVGSTISPFFDTI